LVAKHDGALSGAAPAADVAALRRAQRSE
jgi:hypothetical protein